MSHDLRAPLTHLTGFADLLLQKYNSELNEQAQKYLTRIHDAALRMSALIDDLIRLARVSRQGLLRRPVRLETLVDEVLKDLEGETGNRAIDWRISRLRVIQCDHGLMKQVLANLISNAIKFTRPRELATIEIGERLDGGESIFFVRDNGVGFDMHYADKLFAPFQRLHQQAEFEGTGIGLATVRRIIEKHKGRIWAESQPGQGSTFYFTLGEEDAAAHTRYASTIGVA